MKLRHLSARLLLTSVLLSSTCIPRAAFAQGGAPEQASAQALQLFNAGNYKDAAAAYEDILKNYPTSTVVPSAQFELGYTYYVLGDFDKAVSNLKKVLGPPAPPEIQELAYALIPQALAGRASKLTDEAQKKAGFQDAIKQFDVFLQKYPNGDEVETATYGKALACYQIEKYDDAVAALRGNLQHFPRSESILDSQYLLALTLATQANIIQRAHAGTRSPEADAKYDEAEKFLGDIIAKRTDVALMNDAQFQLGELLFNRAALGDKAKAVQTAVFNKAIEAYRAVLPKEPMIKAQQARLANVRQRKLAALTAHDTAHFKRLQQLEQTETTKLTALTNKPDQTISAEIKVGEIFFEEGDFDAARTLLRVVQPFAEDTEQKKTIAYYTTLTYASQKLEEKAVEAYNEFNSNFKGDPTADNLPLVIGSLFLDPDPKLNDPSKAVEYFKEGTEIYPHGRFTSETLSQQAAALLQLKRYDEALKAYRDFLAQKPKSDLAAAAEFGIGTVLKDTGKTADAISQFKKVRSTYPGTSQAEQASFWVPQLALQTQDYPTAIAEFTNFLKNFPDSQLSPTAKYGLAQATLAQGDKAAALQLFKQVADQYPNSDAAPYCYFQRASILASDKKLDDVLAIMRDFIAKYPDHSAIYDAYQTIGQIQINSSKPLDAIATYTEMVEKHGQDPKAAAAYLNLAQLWHRQAEAQGPYLAMNEQQREDWNKAIANSLDAGEKLLANYPNSPEVAAVLQELLADQKLLASAKVKTEDDIAKYFEDLADKFESTPATKSKVLFTLASFTYDKDKAKALKLMNSAFDTQLVYAPNDLDLYGSALIDDSKLDDAQKVYEKLATDYPNPPGIAPQKAPYQTQQAQAMSIYGLGRILQKQGKVAAAAAKFDDLKKLYPWSPKLVEANFGIAEALHQQNKDKEAIDLLVPVIRANNATAELRANAMLLLGDIQQAKGDLASAIDDYIKVSVFYPGVPSAAAEGLWKGAQLLEKQSATLPDTAAKSGDPTKPGQLAKAIKAYQNLTTKFSSSKYADQAKARLSTLEPTAK